MRESSAVDRMVLFVLIIYHVGSMGSLERISKLLNGKIDNFLLCLITR